MPSLSLGEAQRSSAVSLETYRLRSRTSRKTTGSEREPEGAFGYVEDVFYVAVAAALALAGVMLFGYVIYDFAVRLFDGGELTDLILELPAPKHREE